MNTANFDVGKVAIDSLGKSKRQLQHSPEPSLLMIEKRTSKTLQIITFHMHYQLVTPKIEMTTSPRVSMKPKNASYAARTNKKDASFLGFFSSFWCVALQPRSRPTQFPFSPLVLPLIPQPHASVIVVTDNHPVD